jgi:opacity protein-like surface antigen
MKSKIAMAFLLFLNICANAQINGRNYEMSFSGSFQEIKATLESSDGKYSYSSEGDFSYYINLDFRFGYLFYKGLEIEPELQYSLFEKLKTSYVINANLLYHINTDSSKLKPFLLIGYGLGKSFPFPGSYLSFEDEPRPTNLFNAGFGLKIFITKNVAVRTEYRFQQYKYTKEYSNIHTTAKYNYYVHNLLFGFSFFL